MIDREEIASEGYTEKGRQRDMELKKPSGGEISIER